MNGRDSRNSPRRSRTGSAARPWPPSISDPLAQYEAGEVGYTDQEVRDERNGLYARVCERWYDAANLRVYALTSKGFEDGRPVIHAVALQNINVQPEHRRKGHCRRLIEALCADERFEMVVVEGVLNQHLRAALLRWGWQYDAGVKDFYRRRIGPPRPA